MHLTQVAPTSSMVGQMEDYPENVQQFESRFSTEEAGATALCWMTMRGGADMLWSRAGRLMSVSPQSYAARFAMDSPVADNANSARGSRCVAPG